MNALDNFVNFLCGEFDNSEQLQDLKLKGIEDYPYARHINHVCNDKMLNVDKDVNGKFLILESYYTINGRTRELPHFFLITQEGEKIKLISYDIPKDFNNSTFKYQNVDKIDYLDLKINEKFVPAIYECKNGVWEGGSISMFSPTIKFKFFQKISENCLEVSEIMENNGKRTFGYDIPIIYKRNVY